jgi:hypothetical protein
MRILSYSGESVLTTNGVGEAVVDYVRALIAENSSDVIDIPVLLDDEELTASLVIGPSSQIMVAPSRDRDVALRDELTIARIRSRIAALGPRRAFPTEAGPSASDDLDYDDL